jgi:hypothetical protein
MFPGLTRAGLAHRVGVLASRGFLSFGAGGAMLVGYRVRWNPEEDDSIVE